VNKAWHYAGAVLVVVVGIWVASVIPNPLSSLSSNKT
jgi:hypothetical protein